MSLLVRPQALYRRAFAEGWALGAFNTTNLEVTQAIAAGLEISRAPGIMQVTETTAAYAGLGTLFALMESVSKAAGVPIILHGDHGKSEAHVRACIDQGFPSVMIDGSRLPFGENVALTGSVVRYAHPRGVWVEGELGVIRGKEGMGAAGRSVAPEEDPGFTDPKEARRFVAETAVDALAVSVGTLHGAFRGREAIRFERLRAIHEAVPETPLVLHGGSGLDAEELRRAVGLGVAKVNIDTTLRLAFREGLVRGLSAEEEEEGLSDPRKILAPAREAVSEAVKEACHIVGSAGKA